MPEMEESMSVPRLTVLIPVYNGENYLRETIESVLAQSYPATEVLVINDGSTDQTSAIARSFGNRIRLIEQRNAGVSGARNLGIALASTEWIALMDHDDLWEVNHLENLTKAIAGHPRADLCYTGRRHLVTHPETGLFLRGDVVNVARESDIGTVLQERCPFMPSSVAIRRSSVMDIGGFDGRHSNGQDWDLWLRLFYHGAQFVHWPEPTLLYRVHPESRTNRPLTALNHYKNVVEQNIIPRLPFIQRITHGPLVISRLEGEASLLLRQNGMPGAIPLMLRSIARHPFHDIRRYRIVSHMLLRGYPRNEAPISGSNAMTSSDLTLSSNHGKVRSANP